MSQELVIPELGESITEAQIVQWRKKEGDRVEQDEIVADLETDKATLELPSSMSGVIETILKEEGATVQVGEAIARISEKGAAKSGGKKEKAPDSKAENEEAEQQPAESADDGKKSNQKEKQRKEPAVSHRRNVKQQAQETEQAQEEEAASEGKEKVGEGEGEGLELVEGKPQEAPPVETRPRLMPAAKEALEEYGIEPEHVEGSGPAGRILPEDVRQAAQQRESSEAMGEARVTTMSKLHQQDAAAILEAWNTIPQAGLAEEIDLSELDKMLAGARTEVFGHNDADIHLTAYIAATLLHLLSRFPELNAEVRGIELVHKSACHLAVLVNTEAGDVAPVLRSAERMSPVGISRSLHELRQRALRGELSPEDLEDGTMTLESTHYGRVLFSIPSVRLGESAAFAINAARQRSQDGRPTADSPRKVIVSMAYDQRIVSGVRAEAALHALKSAIENPVLSILTR